MYAYINKYIYAYMEPLFETLLFMVSTHTHTLGYGPAKRREEFCT